MNNYVLIKGSFHVVGFSPDGDSMMFKAEKDELWKKLDDSREDKDKEKKREEEKKKNGGAVQLRLQGIDALETHYCPSIEVPDDVKNKIEKYSLGKKPTIDSSQTDALAREAANRFMAIIGVQNPNWQPVFGGHYVASIKTKDGQVVTPKKDPDNHKILVDKFEGYIVTRGKEKNDRPLVWAFPGKPRKSDTESLEEDDLIKRVGESINYRLLQEGLVYPYIFSVLNETLRKELKNVAKKAAGIGCGVWEKDITTRGIRNSTVEEIEKEVIFPDLFRKIIKKWHEKNLTSFWDAVRQNNKYDAPAAKTLIDLEKLILDKNKVGYSNALFALNKQGALYMTKDPWVVEF